MGFKTSGSRLTRKSSKKSATNGSTSSWKLSSSDKEWLIWLQKELHEWIQPSSFAYSKRQAGYWDTLRNIFEDEWVKLVSILDAGGGLVFGLGTMHGFSLLLNVYEAGPFPEERPKHLLFFMQRQIPEQHGTTEAAMGGANDSWRNAWNIMTKWSHSNSNREELKFYNMEEPEDDTHYMY